MNAVRYAPDPTLDGWMKSCTCRAMNDAGKAAGRAFALDETISRTVATLLYRQAKQRFGGDDPVSRERLDALGFAFARDRLNELADRLITATSWADWIADFPPPPPAPKLPEYTKNLEIDLEESGPSIDSHMQVDMFGKKQIMHMRIQKWYQPDLDRHLYEESSKLEKKFGSPPMVAVILMWPPAEGPGTTGRYVVPDGKGKVFTYQIQRAWEMPAEQAAQSPGTMMLAPLGKGAKDRMPEIVRLIKTNLDKSKANTKTREMVWETVYWAMGLICDLEEAHRALGDMLPFIENIPHVQSAKGYAFMNAYSATLAEGPPLAARALILRQANHRFGVNPDAEKMLEGITAVEELEAIALRMFTASSWEELLGR